MPNLPGSLPSARRQLAVDFLWFHIEKSLCGLELQSDPEGGSLTVVELREKER